MNSLLDPASKEGFYSIGRNPHNLTIDELEAGGFTPHSATKAIRRHCYECMGESWKCVAECGSFSCVLWPFRTGTRPKAWRGLRSSNTEANTPAPYGGDDNPIVTAGSETQEQT